MKRFGYIDALRGYAILGVLLVHSGQYAGFSASAAFGARGVQLFFVASALTLMISWHERHDGVAAFFTRRLFRITPMYWLSIPITLGLMPVLNGTALNAQIIAAAFFLQSIRPDWIEAAIVPGGWSVCAEVAFYCTFPLIGFYITSISRAFVLAVAAFTLARIWMLHGAAVAATLFPGSSGHEIDVFVFLSFPAQLPAFASGIFAFFLIPLWKQIFSRRVSEIVLVLALMATAYFAAYSPPKIPMFSILFCIIATCLANGAGSYLVNGVIKHIGKVSFSIYLLQWIGFRPSLYFVDALQLDGGTRFLVLFLSEIIVSSACATLTYLLIELPFIRLGNHLIKVRKLRVAGLQSRIS